MSFASAAFFSALVFSRLSDGFAPSSVAPASGTSGGISAMYHQDEAMRQQFEEWGQSASDEISSLLNSFHASVVRGEQGEEMVANLEA